MSLPVIAMEMFALTSLAFRRLRLPIIMPIMPIRTMSSKRDVYMYTDYYTISSNTVLARNEKLCILHVSFPSFCILNRHLDLSYRDVVKIHHSNAPVLFLIL